MNHSTSKPISQVAVGLVSPFLCTSGPWLPHTQIYAAMTAHGSKIFDTEIEIQACLHISRVRFCRPRVTFSSPTRSAEARARASAKFSVCTHIHTYTCTNLDPIAPVLALSSRGFRYSSERTTPVCELDLSPVEPQRTL